MNPALSVLIFTVSSGAGYGLFMVMICTQLLRGSIATNELLVGGIVGLVFVTLGLLSSTLHLANPKNAWRAFNRFRTSWLSREGVFAVLFYPVVLAYGALTLLNASTIVTLSHYLLGGLSVLIALATVTCTGMIYASLKPIRQWHNRFTTPLYILFSLMSGSLLLLALQSSLLGDLNNTTIRFYLFVAAIAAISKFGYFLHIGKPQGATINSATSLGKASQAQVRLLDAGHTSDTFLSNEFVFDAGALKLLRLRKLMQLLTFILPMGLMLASYYSNQHYTAHYAVWLALGAMMLGLFIERWLFFAEARHVVRLYHGEQRT